jgi:hypothetical protein
VAFIVFQELFRQWHLLFFRNCSDSGIYCFSGTVQTVAFIVFQELFNSSRKTNSKIIEREKMD